MQETPKRTGMCITFRVPGKPHGQGRARATSAGGFARVYKAKGDKLYESRVAEAFYIADLQRRALPLTACYVPNPAQGAILLTVVAVYGPPKSMKKAIRKHFAELTPTTLFDEWGALRFDPAHRTQRPDLSNIVKAVEDGLNGLAWVDDKQVVGERAMKHYGPEDCVWVRIEEISV